MFDHLRNQKVLNMEHTPLDNGLSIRFRVAKITLKKIGYFVSIWKRIGNRPIQPYDLLDSVDFFVICVRKNGRFGQFVFPKSVLYEKDIIRQR